MAESTVFTLEIEGQADSGIDALKQTADAMESVEAKAGSAGSGLKEAGSGAKEAGSSFSGMGGALNSALGVVGQISPQMSQASGATRELGGSMGELAEVAGSLGGVVSGLAAVGAVLGGAWLELGHQGAEYNHTLVEQQALTGMSIKDLAVWGKAYEEVGGSQDDVTSGARIFNTVLTGLQDTVMAGTPLTTKQREEMKLLDGSITDSTGHMKTYAGAFPEVMANLAGMTDVTTRNQLATDFFGRSSTATKELLNEYATALPKASAEVERLGINEDKVKAQNEAYNETMTHLHTTFQALAITAVPSLITVMKASSDIIDFTSAHWDTFKSIAGTIATVALPNLAEAFNLGVLAVGAFSDVSGTVSSVVGAFSSLASGIQSAVGGVASAISGASSMFSGFGEGAASAAGAASSAFSAAAGAIGGAIAAAGGVLGGFEGMVSSVASAVSGAFGAVSGVISSVASAIGSAIGAASSVLGTLASAAGSVAGAITSAFNAIKDAITSAVGAAVDAINSLIDAIGSIPGIGMIGQVVGAVGGALGFASGGGVTAGQTVRVNEIGQEFFRPSVSGNIIPLTAMGAGAGGGGGGGTTVYNLAINANVIGLDNLRNTVMGWMRDASQYGSSREWLGGA